MKNKIKIPFLMLSTVYTANDFLVSPTPNQSTRIHSDSRHIQINVMYICMDVQMCNIQCNKNTIMDEL